MAIHPLYGSPDVFEVNVPVATLWTSPEAPRDIDAAAVQDVPDVAGWTAAMDAAQPTGMREGLNGRTLTQLLLGEGVQVVEEQDDWVRVVSLFQPSSQHRVGYPGWMRRAHLGAPVMRTTGATVFVVTRTAMCTLEDDSSTRELSFGTALWVDDVTEDSVGVLLPGGRRGRLPVSDVRLGDKTQQPTYATDDLLDTARQFLGMRYLWGGNSAWGLDCSGLVHLSYRAQGVVVPRDAFDQVEHVTAVGVDEVEPGDLYFFAKAGAGVSHVGFVTRRVDTDGTRWMLHAPGGGESIEDAPMAPDRAYTLVSAGRVRSQGRDQSLGQHRVLTIPWP